MSAGQFRELEKLAEGGMAEIRAGTSADGRAVVIKRIRIHLLYDEDHRRLFADEGALSARLEHKHIVPLLDSGEDDCGPYLVFEYVEGTDLAAVLDARCAEKRPLEPAQAMAVALPLLSALAYAHNVCADGGESLCVVHRDISPGNVLLGENGDVKLTDFGVAASSLRTDQTVAGEMKGKFAYMAPEQTRGEVVDARADIFSAGIVLYEMLTGRRLFDANTDADVVHAVREQDVPSIREHNPDVPEQLEALVVEMLHKDRNLRPADAATVRDRLLDIAETCCFDQGLKRHVKQLCQQHPRTVLESSDQADSGPKRRHTQRVLGADTGIQVVRDDERRPRWPVALLGLLVVAAAGAFFLPRAAVAPANVTADGDVAEKAADKPRPPPELAATVEPDPVSKPPKEKPEATPPAAVSRAKTEPKAADQPKAVASKPKLKPRPVKVARATPRRAPPGAVVNASTRPPVKVQSGFGEVYISSEPWAEVYVDGARFGVTPVTGKKLPAGPHTVRLYNPHYKLERTFNINVSKNKKTTKFVELTK